MDQQVSSKELLNRARELYTQKEIADRVGVELMGIDFGKVGYLNYCAQTGLGTADLSKIEIVGEKISDHIKQYKLHENIEQQLIWMKPVS